MSEAAQILTIAFMILNLILAYGAVRKDKTASVVYHMGFALIMGVILF